MRDMKDSEIDVVNDIPQCWIRTRLKYLCSFQTGDEDTQNADSDGDYPFYVRSPIVERCNRYTFSGEGILVAGDGAGAGRIFHHAFGKYAVHQRVYRLSDFKHDSKFIHYYLSNLFPFEMDKGSAQSTVPSMRLPMLMNFPVCIPPVTETKIIVDFLDKKTAELGQLVEEINDEIELLEQYRKAVIIEAVTRGIDKTNTLVDTKIGYVGRMPETWRLSSIKYEIFPIERPIHNKDGIVTCFRDGEVTLRSNRREEGFTISMTEHGYHGVKKGDLVIHGMDAFAGAIGCSDSDGKISPVVHVCKTSGNNRFFMYRLRAMAYGEVLMDLSDGVRIRSSDYRNFSKLGKFKIGVPSLNEQNQIVDYLDSVVPQLEILLDEKRGHLDLITDYKKSLIYEYVTGKKEVPAS